MVRVEEIVTLLGGWPALAVGTIAMTTALILIMACDGLTGAKTRYIICALVLTGSAGLVNGTVGVWIHKTITDIDGAVSPKVGEFTGLGVALLVAIVVFGTALGMVVTGDINTGTLVLIALVPVFTSFIPGPAGVAAMTIAGVIPAALGGIIHLAFWGSWA
jgi:hypothetical protein